MVYENYFLSRDFFLLWIVMLVLFFIFHFFLLNVSLAFFFVPQQKGDSLIIIETRVTFFDGQI